MDKMLEITLLFDFYGQLLTDKQREIILLYYYDDLSLGEIAERLKISRQGVYDHLHRSEDLLRGFEEKLGFVKIYQDIRKDLDELEQYLLKLNLEEQVRERLRKGIARIRKRL